MIVRGEFTKYFGRRTKSVFHLNYKYNIKTPTRWQRLLLFFKRSCYSIDTTTMIKFKMMKGRFYLIDVIDIETITEFPKFLKDE